MDQKVPKVDYLVSLGKIIAAYEEIAAKRMQEIKGEVLQNRQFLAELNQVFQIVKNTYQKKVAKHHGQIQSEKKAKAVRVLISANTGLYGDIIQRIFAIFRADLRKKPSDIVIIGQLGKNLARGTHLNQGFIYFDFPDAKFDRSTAKKLVELLIDYQKVVVYHGMFKNILMQEPASTNITGDAPISPVKETTQKRLLFEPSLPQILKFFETEFFSSLLVQTIYEAQLAKFSARMASLEQANENIKKATHQARWVERKARHRLANKKQLGLMTGLQLWGN